MVRLVPISGETVRDILKLQVLESQRNFVAPNDMSLIEAYIALSHRGQAFPFGIYDGDVPVGFCMIGYGADDDWKDAPAVARDNYNLWRLMIDRRHQGKGYGRAAMERILAFIAGEPCGPADFCWLSYEPENTAAAALYASFGFRETGEWDGEEKIAVRRLSRPEAAIHPVTGADRESWFSLDRHLSGEAFDRKVRDRMGYVLTLADRPAGILRWSLFWDSIPFCNMRYIREGERRKGLGRALMARWEQDMKALGYGLVMTSTQSDEEGQRFYRALGYVDCGSLTLPFRGYEQPTELFLAKAL